MLNFPEPNWSDVLGAASETAWIVDRDRKIGNALKLATAIQDAYHYLSERDAVFQATPDIVLDCQFAARWYVSLAGYSQKTLQNIRERPSAFGLNVRPNTIVDFLCEHTPEGPVSNSRRSDIERFCAWINDEILQKHPTTIRDTQRALIVVAEILGGRIIGQGQNEGGDVAVLLVKELLIEALLPDFPLEVSANGGWETFTAAHSVSDVARFRFGQALICDFTSGGNRPDITVSIDGEVLAVGEIKGRKDLSNVWESWMPQVATHMNAWTAEFPMAARLFFGTLIVEQMVEGFSTTGTRQVGFRELHSQQKLTAVYNVGNVIAGHAGAKAAFRLLTGELARVLRFRQVPTKFLAP